jgi:hypothetical protein
MGGRRDSRELLGGVDLLASTVEVGVAHAVRVVVAAVGVAVTGVAVVGVGAAAVGGGADVELVVLASVGSEGIRVSVGLPISSSVRKARSLSCLPRGFDLPDIDLGAASTVAADTSLVVAVGRLPALNVALCSRVC